MAPPFDGVHAYTGSTLLQPLSQFVGLPIDQINYVTCQLLGLFCGYGLRLFLCPTKASPSTRHLFSALLGAATIQFCFGRQVNYLVFMASVVYLILRMIPPLHAHKVVFCYAIGYLSVIQIWRVQNPTETVDITGPLMVMTQKVTVLAFGLRDGAVERKDFDSLRPNHSISQRPSLVEYISYLFHFQTLTAGPMIFYDDYIAFIEGKSHAASVSSLPSPTTTVVFKVILAASFGLVTVYGTAWLPLSLIAEPSFIAEHGLLARILYAYISTTMVRAKYYYVWTMADAISNASGLGYCGGERWDGLSNVDIWDFETSLAFRSSLSHWNKQTGCWLRYVSYDRVSPRWALLATYCLSAVWHGFHPGYYWTFLTGAVFTLAARQVRRVVRPVFTRSAHLHTLYDVITFLATRAAITYVATPFVLLHWSTSLVFFQSTYFLGHIVAVLALLVLPAVPSNNNNRGKPRKHHRGD